MPIGFRNIADKITGAATGAATSASGRASRATAKGGPLDTGYNSARAFVGRHKTGVAVGGAVAGAYTYRSTLLSNRHKRRQGRVGPQSSLAGNTAVNGLTAHSLGGSTYASR